MRQVERESRKEAVQQLTSTLSILRSTQSSPEFSHVDPAKLQSLATKIAEVEKWMRNTTNQLDSAPLHQDAMIKAKEFSTEAEVILNGSVVIELMLCYDYTSHSI